MTRKLILVRPTAPGGDLLKAHIKGYTKKSGTYVKEHYDKRQKKAPEPPHGEGYSHPSVVGKAEFVDRYSKDAKDAAIIKFAGTEYAATGKSGTSFHDQTPVREFESGDGHRIWLDDHGRVHADATTEVEALRRKYEAHAAEVSRKIHLQNAGAHELTPEAAKKAGLAPEPHVNPYDAGEKEQPTQGQLDKEWGSKTPKKAAGKAEAISGAAKPPSRAGGAAAGAGGAEEVDWELKDSDATFGGKPSLTIETADGKTLYVVKDAAGQLMFGEYAEGDDEPSFTDVDPKSLAAAVHKHGIDAPPQAALDQLGGMDEPPAKGGGGGPAVSNNKAWGFYNSVLQRLTANAHGEDVGPYELPEEETAKLLRAADVQFDKAAKKLVALDHFDTVAQAVDFLDSRMGRHLGDEADNADAIANVKWLGKAVAEYKKDSNLPFGGSKKKAAAKPAAAPGLSAAQIKLIVDVVSGMGTDNPDGVEAAVKALMASPAFASAGETKKEPAKPAASDKELPTGTVGVVSDPDFYKKGHGGYSGRPDTPDKNFSPKKKAPLPSHWREAHDHAQSVSYAAWNSDEGSHEEAAAALRHSAKLHTKAAQAALDDGDEEASAHHKGKAAANLAKAKEHAAQAKKGGTMLAKAIGQFRYLVFGTGTA